MEVAQPSLQSLFLLLCSFLHLSRDGAKRAGRGTVKFLAQVCLWVPLLDSSSLRPLAHVLAHSRHSVSANSSFLISAGN